jgi:hypothetical protein
MALQATDRPALRTIDTLRGGERKRIANLAIKRLNAHSQAEEKAKSAHPTSILAKAAAHSGRLLWLLPTLITRDTLDDEQERSENVDLHRKDNQLLRNLIKQRLQQAEHEHWGELIADYHKCLRKVDSQQGRGNLTATDLPMNTPDDLNIFKRVAYKVGGKVIRSTKEMLMGGVTAPQTEATPAKVRELVATPVTENELTAIAYKIAEIRKPPTALKCTPLEVRKVRDKLHDLALGAQCGRSGWRNYLIQSIGEQEGGHVAIATWQNLWPRGKLQLDVIELFTAATVTPVGGGCTGERNLA